MKKPISMVPDLRRVMGRVCVENLLWLRRTMVLIMLNSTNDNEIHDRMGKLGLEVVAIRSMGSLKFLVTFRNGELMEEAIILMFRSMNDGVISANKWSTSDLCDRRRVWVEILGIPPHVWCKENIINIVSSLGSFQIFDQNIDDGSSLESVKVLIHTKYMLFIEERMILRVENEDFEIFVREIDRDTDWKPLTIEEEGSHGLPEISRIKEATLEETQDGNQQRKVDEEDELSRISDREDTNGQEPLLNVFQGKEFNVVTNYSLIGIENTMENVDYSNEAMNNNDNCTSQKTATALVDYNIEEGMALIAQYFEAYDGQRNYLCEEYQHGLVVVNSENKNMGHVTEEGPPGFYTENRHLTSPTQIELNEVDTRTTRATHGPSKSSTNRRQKKGSTLYRKKKKKRKRKTLDSNDHKFNESLDDNHSNDKKEAHRTWNLGKQLDLKTRDEDKVLGSIVMLRRSARRMEREARDAPN
ncbi:hypothetical protein RIF29_30266 [Crotalaria pallida]|uniref:DUF4283 domain-containing protein n=1 Tax=Crotalaria pallida TaxID=3830 RepID=A0AAN9EL55_CROPI